MKRPAVVGSGSTLCTVPAAAARTMPPIAIFDVPSRMAVLGVIGAVIPERRDAEGRVRESPGIDWHARPPARRAPSSATAASERRRRPGNRRRRERATSDRCTPTAEQRHDDQNNPAVAHWRAHRTRNLPGRRVSATLNGMMIAIRRRVRAVAFAWLLCQVASLSAFVPEIVLRFARGGSRGQEKKAAACHEDAGTAPRAERRRCVPDASRARTVARLLRDHQRVRRSGHAPRQPVRVHQHSSKRRASRSMVLDSIAAFVPPAPPLLYRLATPDAPPPKA